MKFEIKAKVELKTHNGKIIKTIEKTLKSYVIGLVDLLYGFFYSTAYTSTVAITDTDDSSRSIIVSTLGQSTFKSFCANCAAIATDDTYGIQTGTNDTAVLITNNKMGTKITHGDTSTKLNYGACSVGSPATVGTSRQFTIARTFTNNSGANIDVKEIGLILKVYDFSVARYIMIEHSLLSFTIINGTSGTVTYTISATV